LLASAPTSGTNSTKVPVVALRSGTYYTTNFWPNSKVPISVPLVQL
jgi:hypothetical protein